MINLGNETLKALHNHGYSIDDISWIGSEDMVIPVTNFMSIAFDTDYNNGYGAEEIAMDLIIVMKDGCWYHRNCYDGSERWKFNRCPQRPERLAEVTTLTGGYVKLKYLIDKE